jgi:hypothetical protein
MKTLPKTRQTPSATPGGSRYWVLECKPDDSRT